MEGDKPRQLLGYVISLLAVKTLEDFEASVATSVDFTSVPKNDKAAKIVCLSMAYNRFPEEEGWSFHKAIIRRMEIDDDENITLGGEF